MIVGLHGCVDLLQYNGTAVVLLSCEPSLASSIWCGVKSSARPFASAWFDTVPMCSMKMTLDLPDLRMITAPSTSDT